MARFPLITALFISVVLILTLRVMIDGDAPPALEQSSSSPATSFQYETVSGVFSPSVDGTDGAKYDYIKSDLGLIAQEYETDPRTATSDAQTEWTRLQRHVDHLNSGSPSNVQYKVLILGRHGEGWHNLAETKYGREAWDAHWSLLEGDETMKWADALLTPEGQKQALAAHAFWKEGYKRGIPAANSYYTSPLSRCLQTSNFTFSALSLPKGKPFKPVVKELLRETNGVHTCDRRSSVTQLRAAFPSEFMSTFTFEPGFPDDDPLWSADERETDEETQARVRKLLDDIFSHDRGTWISLTSHSGAVRAILGVVGHRDFRLGQGSVMAALVRGEAPLSN